MTTTISAYIFYVGAHLGREAVLPFHGVPNILATKTEERVVVPDRIADDVLEIHFPIPGLRFTPNALFDISGHDGWFSLKVSSSEGPLISDFVTHEEGFAYATYGIHIGQEDRLTFFGDSRRSLIGHFIDCRKNSPTLHQEFSVEYSPSPARKLIIPRGVAHTFDGLEGIVTRDEPVWYSAENNPDWNIDNDLISVSRTGERQHPVVRINEYPLPDAVHIFMSRLSQELLEKPAAYSARYPVKIGGKHTYVTVQDKSWVDNEDEVHALIGTVSAPGIVASRSRYALTGERSWTLVPSVDSGVADVLYIDLRNSRSDNMFVHQRTKKFYTFLTNEGSELSIRTLDLRANSPTYKKRTSLSTKVDPRVTIQIEPGIAYSFAGDTDCYVRCEHEVFVSKDEPREDLPMFGRDLLVVGPDELPAISPEIPDIRCPLEIVRLMARNELALLSEG